MRNWILVVVMVAAAVVTALEYNEIDSTNGPVRRTSYTQEQFEATLRHLRRPTQVQTLTGAGTIDLEKLITFVNVTSGTVTLTLPSGTVTNQQKEIYFVGSGGTANMVGTLHDFTGVQFDTNARSGTLFWVNAKWMFVAGNGRPY